MDDLKVYLVMRADLKMRRGKEIAQACHALQYLQNDWSQVESVCRFDQWNKSGHAKIAVSVSSENNLAEIVLGVGKYNNDNSKYIIRSQIVVDEGRTEIPRGTITCAAIGPVTHEEAISIGLSGLKLR